MKRQLSKNEILGRKLASNQARRLDKDRSRAGAGFSSGNGLGASKKRRWKDFEELEPRPEPIVVR